MTFLPVPVDRDALLKRLFLEEQSFTQRLAKLEDQIRSFEDFERPAYEQWIRIELGPKLKILEEIFEKIRERRMMAHRIHELVQKRNLHPREALYCALGKDFEEEVSPHQAEKGDWGAEEKQARKQAKLEAKRAA